MQLDCYFFSFHVAEPQTNNVMKLKDSKVIRTLRNNSDLLTLPPFTLRISYTVYIILISVQSGWL